MTFTLGPTLRRGTHCTKAGIQAMIIAERGNHVIFQWAKDRFNAVVTLALFNFFRCETRTLLRS